jgi:hypothetical protein
MKGSSRWSSILDTLVSFGERCFFVLSLHLIADFFDGKHNIVLGGSWATHPRLAGRKSL